MKQILFFVFLFLIKVSVFAQQKDTTTKEFTVLIGEKTTTITPTSDSTKIFTVVQEPAKFPGGLSGWSKYLQTNLNVDLGAKYVKIPKGMKEVRQIVQVQFLVDTLGNISNVKVLNPKEIHPKLVKESIRVIKEGPNWSPAKQNGKKVMYRHTQTITWVISDE